MTDRHAVDGADVLLDAVAGAHSWSVVCDIGGGVRWASPALRPALADCEPVDLVHPDDRRAVAGLFRRVAATGGVAAVSCRVLGPAGHGVGELTVRHCGHPDGPVVVVAFGAAGSPSTLADGRDHLTGLVNRSTVMQGLDGEGSLAVLFCDLDGFKLVNDSFGHGIGDQLLVAAAERLRRAVRPGDTVGRFGGDEFVVLAAGVDSAQVALEISTRAQVALSQPYHIAGRRLRVTASIGAAIGRAGASGPALLSAADTAMYLAKRSGGARCEVYEPGMQGEDQRHRTATATLRQALDVGSMAVAYTPVVDLRTQSPTAQVAQLQLLDGRGVTIGSLADGSTVAEAAERSGLAVSVGAGLLDAACAERCADPVSGPVWVPVSARQLATPRLAAQVSDVLTRHGVEPAQLVVEVPDEVAATGDDTVERNLLGIRQAGVGLALTGFGASGIDVTALTRLRPDVVVLDPSLVAADADPAPAAAVVALARAVGARTAVEGVTEPSDLARLCAAGVDAASGPLWPSVTPRPLRRLPSARARQRGGGPVVGQPEGAHSTEHHTQRPAS